MSFSGVGSVDTRERHAFEIAAALLSLPLAGVLDEDAPHGLGGGPEEVRGDFPRSSAEGRSRR